VVKPLTNFFKLVSRSGDGYFYALLGFVAVLTQSNNGLLFASDKFSMPSGHTAAAFLMATLIAQFYPDWSILAYSWACAISFSRVFLGVHFPVIPPQIS
jgi:membrane-associated phospholipid phosphatase